MKSIFFTLCALLFVALALAQQSPVTFSSSQLNARIDPADGSVDIWEANTDRVFTHTFAELRETDQARALVNTVASFADQIFTVSSPTVNNVFQGVNATSASLTASITVASQVDNSTSGATLIATFFVFTAEGNITFNGQIVNVAPDHMVLLYQLQGWPIKSTNNSMSIRVRLDTPSKTGTFNAPVLRLDDGAAITFAQTSTGSSSATDTPASVAVSRGSSSVDYTMTFNAATNVEFTALWSVEPATSGSGGDSSAASALSSPLFSLF